MNVVAHDNIRSLQYSCNTQTTTTTIAAIFKHTHIHTHTNKKLVIKLSKQLPGNTRQSNSKALGNRCPVYCLLRTIAVDFRRAPFTLNGKLVHDFVEAKLGLFLSNSYPTHLPSKWPKEQCFFSINPQASALFHVPCSLFPVPCASTARWFAQ